MEESTRKSILANLKKEFPLTHLRKRALKGGNQWIYIPWQKIRDRLDQVYPEWEIKWSDPIILGELMILRCEIAIAGITREGIGNAELVQLSSAGKDMSRGTPLERARADAFKEACEQFGLGAYLDSPAIQRQLLMNKQIHWEENASN